MWLYLIYIKEAPFNLQGGGGARVFVPDKLFISTRRDGALKISNCTTFLYRTFLGVNYLFHAESAQNYLFQKYSSPPPPHPGDGGPLIENVDVVC